MTGPTTKRIAVLVTAADRARVAEALRAALGLCLRGDRVEVVLSPPARAVEDTPAIARALETLALLGQRVTDGAGEPLSRAARDADVVEVWT